MHPDCIYLKHRGPYCVQHGDKPKPKNTLKTKIIEGTPHKTPYKKRNIKLEKPKEPRRFVYKNTDKKNLEKRVIAVADLKKVVSKPKKVERELYEKTRGNDAKYMRRLAIILRLAPVLKKKTPKEYVSIRLAKVAIKGMSGRRLQWEVRKETLLLKDKYDMLLDPTKHRPQRLMTFYG